MAGRRRVVAVIAAVMFGPGLAGCTASPDAVTEAPRTLTLAEASLLAEALYLNHTAGGATFSLTGIDTRTGATIVIDGVVDWAEGRGTARVAGLRDPDGEVTAAAWTRDAVAEQRPGLAAAMEAAGEDPATTFVLRGADPAGRTLDRMIAIVFGLASTRPDNAQILLQKPDAGFVRTDELRGTAVSVLRFSDRSVLWIDPTTGSLLRFESNDSRGGSQVVIDLLDSGRSEVVLPLVSSIRLGSGG